MRFIEQRLFFILALAGIYLLGAIIQYNILINVDVSWLMHVSKRLLAGGTYQRDFFELNPPLILYLYSPAVMLENFFSLSQFPALCIYIFVLASFSLLLCYQLACRIFRPEDYKILYLFLLALAALFLVLPLRDLGQREHLLFILTMPYLLLVTARLQGCNINPYYAAAIGLLAAAGFGIKPYFISTFALLEIYYIIRARNVLAVFRPEVFAIFALLIAYFISIFVFQPDYINVILPVSLRYYYHPYQVSLSQALLYQPAVFCSFAILFFIIQYKKNPYQTLSSILLLALTGFFISYLIPRTLWPYHLLPAYEMAILLVTLLLGLLVKQENIPAWAAAVLVMLVLYFPFEHANYFYQAALKHKSYLAKLSRFMTANAEHKSIYFITPISSYSIPSINAAHALPAFRTQDSGWVAGILTGNYQQQDKDKNFLIGMLASDLMNHKPDFVFVDTREYKEYIAVRNFNYIHFFSQNNLFRAAWEKYRYVTTIEQTDDNRQPIYKYQVYQRF